MPRLAFLALAALAACATARQAGGPDAEDAGGLRLCVRNATVGYGNLVARAGLVRIDVLPGEEVCRRLTGPGPTFALRAETTGGGAAGRLSYTATLQAGGSSCWRWRLTNQPGSASDLMPCGGEDEPGAR